VPEIRFLSPEELESLRANAEELKKSSSKIRGRKRVDFPYSWNAFPDITVQTTVAKLKAHPDYDAAESGDQDAALRVIDQLFKPGKLTDSCDFIVPVLQLDAGKQNMLAVAYAVRLAKEIGGEVFLRICQSNQVSHTGADAVTRILGQPTFVGQIAGGRRVLVVDDVPTFGSTLANLRGWIEHQGAHVIRATTLGATFGASWSKPPGLVRIRHYGILGNNRRKRAIEAARAIFERRGHAVELQPQSVADKSTCCPLCGKAGIRLVAFTDAAGVLHMMGAGPTPCDSS